MAPLDVFLQKHKIKKGEQYTHTRIGDKNSDIYGGAYFIPISQMKNFQKLYTNHVLKKKNKEYLTEAQDRENGGAILIDFDFRYSTEITERQHSEEHINDIVELYVEKIHELFNLDKKSFTIYVFEKPNIVTKDDIVKDGIHMIIGLHLKHDQQMLLRKHVLTCIGPQILDDLCLENTPDNVLDEAITSGRNNWMMYGSRKPNNEAYELTYYYKITIDTGDEGIHKIEEQDIKNIKDSKAVRIFSPRYSEWPKCKLKEGFEAELNQLSSQRNSSGHAPLGTAIVDIPGSLYSYVSRENLEALIVDKPSLDEVMNLVFAFLDKNNPSIREVHEYTMALPEKYYTDYGKWVGVAMALKSTSELLLPTFIYFSSQWDRFDYNNISDVLDKWQGISNREGSRLTHLSIRYWCQLDNKEEYDRIREKSTDMYIKKTLTGGPQNAGADYDMAVLAHHLYKDQFRCVAIKKIFGIHFKVIDGENVILVVI